MTGEDADASPCPAEDGVDQVVDGVVRMAGRDWRWTRSVAATDDPDIQRIDVRVASPDGRAADRTLFRSRT